MCWKQWLLWNSVGYWIGFLLLHKKSLATNSATSNNSRTVSQFLWPGVWPWLSCVVCFGSHGAAGCWLCCVLSRGLTGISLVLGLGLSHGFLEAAPSTGSHSRVPFTAVECVFLWPCPPRRSTEKAGPAGWASFDLPSTELMWDLAYAGDIPSLCHRRKRSLVQGDGASIHRPRLHVGLSVCVR